MQNRIRKFLEIHIPMHSKHSSSEGIRTTHLRYIVALVGISGIMAAVTCAIAYMVDKGILGK